MSDDTSIQRCVVCAWRAACQKKFCISDGGARCPDFTRDVTIRDITEKPKEQNK
jgi:hypothetical protein